LSKNEPRVLVFVVEISQFTVLLNPKYLSENWNFRN